MAGIKSPPASPTVLDAFTRADSTELGASWAPMWSGQPGLKIVSNEVQANASGIGGEYWSTAITSADQWVTARIGSTSPASSRLLMLRMSGVGTSSVSGYRLFLNWNEGGQQVWYITKQTSGSNVWSNWALLAAGYGGMPAAGALVGFTAEGSLLTAWIHNGTFWEAVVQCRDTSFTSGSTYAGIGSGYASSDAALDDFACGETSAGADYTYPTVVAASAVSEDTGTGASSVTVTLPAHATNDILVVAATNDAGADITTATAGWAEITEVDAADNFNWFWKRAASASETAPTLTSAGSDMFAAAFAVQGCVTTGTPYEDATPSSAGSSTTPAGSTITTTSTNRLAVTVANVNDDTAWSSGRPPSGWRCPMDASSSGGTDTRFTVITQAKAAAGDVAGATVGTLAASETWATLSLAFIPASSSTNYPQSCTATSTVTAARVANWAVTYKLRPTATVTATRAAGWAVTRALSTTTTVATAIRRAVGKGLGAVTATGSATIATVRGAMWSVTATATVTGAISRAVGALRTVTGTATGSRAPGWAVGRGLAATGSGVPTDQHGVGSSIRGTATATGSRTPGWDVGAQRSAAATGSASRTPGWNVGATRTAASTATGAITRAVGAFRTVTGTVTATVGKGIGKWVAASTTVTAVLDAVRGGITATLDLAVTATGTASRAAGWVIGRGLALTSTGTPTTQSGVGSTIRADASGTTTDHHGIGTSRSATATGAAALAIQSVISLLIAATSSASASISRAVGAGRTATSTTTATISRAVATTRAVTVTVNASILRAVGKNIGAATVSAAAATWRDVGKFLRAATDNGSPAGSIDLDGTTAYAAAPLTTTNRPETNNAFSWVGWVWMDATDNNVLPRFWETAPHYLCVMGNPGNGQYRRVGLEVVDTASAAHEFWSTTRLDTNRWYHVAVTFDGSLASEQARMWIDGVEESVTEIFAWPGGGTMKASSGSFWVGRRNSDLARNLDGRLGRMALYQRALSEDEVRVHAVTGTPPGAGVEYPVDEGSGPSLNDASGNGNTATLTNAAWVVEPSRSPVATISRAVGAFRTVTTTAATSIRRDIGKSLGTVTTTVTAFLNAARVGGPQFLTMVATATGDTTIGRYVASGVSAAAAGVTLTANGVGRFVTTATTGAALSVQTAGRYVTTTVTAAVTTVLVRAVGAYRVAEVTGEPMVGRAVAVTHAVTTTIAAGVLRGVTITLRATATGIAELLARLTGLVTSPFDPPAPDLTSTATARAAGFDPPAPDLATTTAPDVAGFDPPGPRLEV